MTAPSLHDRLPDDVVGLLLLRTERLTITPGQFATYCPMDADLDLKAVEKIRALEEGLRPFAAWAASFDGDAVEYPAPDTCCVAIRHEPRHRTSLTIADLRRARSLLSTPTKGGTD